MGVIWLGARRRALLVLMSWIQATCEITQRESLLTSSGALHHTIPDIWGYFVTEHQLILGCLPHKKRVVFFYFCGTDETASAYRD